MTQRGIIPMDIALAALDALTTQAALHDLQLAADLAAVATAIDALTDPTAEVDPVWLYAANRRLQRLSATETGSQGMRRLCRLAR